MRRVPGFEVLLARILDHRQLDIAVVARESGVAVSELAGVLEGEAPSPALLRQLAPALNLRTADLFVIAGVPVPNDLAPLDPTARGRVARLAVIAIRLEPGERRRLRQLIQSMPQVERRQPAPAPPIDEQPPAVFGAVLMRMVFNRNLRYLAAPVMSVMIGRPLAESTVLKAGSGDVDSLEMLIGFAAVLGMPAVELAVLKGIDLAALDGVENAALMGVEPPDGSPRLVNVHPAAPDVAELIWDARRLTADQVEQVLDQAAGEADRDAPLEAR